jgi:hypothetical protein
VVHSKSLKPYNGEVWEPRVTRRIERNPREKPARTTPAADEIENDIKIGNFPVLKTTRQGGMVEPVTTPDRTPFTPEPVSLEPDTPASQHGDPTYVLSQKPRSRREMQSTRIEPYITRSRARDMPQEYVSHINQKPPLINSGME